MIADTLWLGKQVIQYKETDSTNVRARLLAQEQGAHGTIVTAESQSAGRGRSGRSWESKAGEGLFMTMLLRPKIQVENASMLTLVAALSVAKAIEMCVKMQPQIKWPNDIVLNKKKICGILTELNATAEGIDYVLIGIGVNVTNRLFPAEIEDMASSLLLECGISVNKEELLAEICRQFESCYEVFCRTEDLSALQKEYNGYLVNKDCQVNILDPKAPFTGIAKGITIRGELQVEVSGEIVHVSSGEVSVRGMYGYV